MTGTMTNHRRTMVRPPDNMEDDIDESEFEPDSEKVVIDDDWDFDDEDITDEYDDED